MTDGDARRDRGILSPADRNFLRSDPDDYSRQAQHAREQAIQERVRNSLLDVPILVEHLNDDLLQAALTAEDGWNPVPALPGLVSFLYQYYGSEYQLERLIEEGVERVRRKQGDPVNARVSIDLFPDRLAEIEDRLDEDGVGGVDHRELEDLWRDGRLTDDEYLSLVEEWEEQWNEARADRIERDGPRRRVVHGALELAKRKVELERKQEASRREFLDESGVDPDDGDDDEA